MIVYAPAADTDGDGVVFCRRSDGIAANLFSWEAVGTQRVADDRQDMTARGSWTWSLWSSATDFLGGLTSK